MIKNSSCTFFKEVTFAIIVSKIKLSEALKKCYKNKFEICSNDSVSFLSSSSY